MDYAVSEPKKLLAICDARCSQPDPEAMSTYVGRIDTDAQSVHQDGMSRRAMAQAFHHSRRRIRETTAYFSGRGVLIRTALVRK